MLTTLASYSVGYRRDRSANAEDTDDDGNYPRHGRRDCRDDCFPAAELSLVARGAVLTGLETGHMYIDTVSRVRRNRYQFLLSVRNVANDILPRHVSVRA